VTYEQALNHLRVILSRSPGIDREALEVVVAGPPVARREEVVTSPADPRVEVATVRLKRGER
jgi:GTP1/Obg family GTP-binding protein